MPDTIITRMSVFVRRHAFVFLLVFGVILLSVLYPLVKDWQVLSPHDDAPPYFVWLFVAVMGVIAIAVGVRDVCKIDSTLFRKLILLTLVGAAVSQVLSIAIGCFWIFCAFALAYGITKRSFSLPVGIFWLLAGYYLYQATGLIGAADMKDALHTLKQQLPFLAMPLAFCCWRPTTKEWGAFLSFAFRLLLVYLSAIVLIYLLLTQYYDQSLMSAFSFDKFYLKTSDLRLIASFHMLFWTHFMHPTYIFLALSTVFIAVAVRQYYYGIRVVSTVEMVYGLVLLFSFVLIMQSRLAMIILPLAILLFIVVRSFVAHEKKLMLLIAFLGILVGGAILNSVFSHRFFADGERMQMRELAMETIATNPFTGIRLGSMDNALQARIVSDVIIKHPHNQLLADGMQHGVPGMIVLAVFVGGLFFFAYRKRHYELLLFLPILILTMAVESPLTFIRGAYLLSFWLCLYAVAPGRHSQSLRLNT